MRRVNVIAAGKAPADKRARQETCFTVLQALGLTRLQKRSGDLDGAVPLRVAQACAPLLEGNAFGFQIVLAKAIEVRRSLGRIVLPFLDHVLLEHRAVLPRLVAQGFLKHGGWWHRWLEGGPVQVERKGLGKPRLLLWTGLLARPDAGVWLRVSGTANRRNLFVEVEETFVPDEDGLTPIVLEIRLRDEAPDRLLLEGEIGTLAPVAPGLSIEDRLLVHEPAVAKAHVEFYDADYFAAKKNEPTRKYRKIISRKPPHPVDGPPRCQVVLAGPASHTVVTARRFACASGPVTAPPAGGSLPSIVFANLVPFEARFDGHTLAVEPDRDALDRGAQAVEETWALAFGREFVFEHRRALWYLTKYFTPHPPGEPHFFVKPWSFTRTPPGWSSLLEGAHGEGWDVMRGVVWTDLFFATPAVFRVQRLGEPIRVAAGEPLLHVLPIPRRLLDAGYRLEAWRDA
jgi:hypothetical protein